MTCLLDSALSTRSAFEVPQLGSGAIYQVLEANNIVVPDFEIPEHYQQAYGLDTG